MIYSLKIELLWSAHATADCVRVIEIPPTATLMDLHGAIQDAVKFDNDHLFEFFVGRNWRHKKICFVDPLQEDDPDEWNRIRLNEIYPLESGLKLFYHFDFGDDWYFQITKSRKAVLENPKAKYPRVTGRIGRNPKQYPEEY